MLDTVQLNKIIGDEFESYYAHLLAHLQTIKLETILEETNPLALAIKDEMLVGRLIEVLLSIWVSKQCEHLFETLLKNTAINICSLAYRGRKSEAVGIDLEFEKDGVWYIVSIKSDPNWGNSRKIGKMVDNFRQAKHILRKQNATMNSIAVNGCCYGKDDQPDKGDYYKFCGQEFWDFISGNENLYIDIVKILEIQAKEKNEEFTKAYAKLVNEFTDQFFQEFCTSGEIDWPKLVKYNSGKAT